MGAHVCRRPRTCSCGITADEPDEQCPVHGAGEWPPRCEVCGRLMKWPERNGPAHPPLDECCHARRDGDCVWEKCPQNRDNEPATTGRSCPLFWLEETDS